MDQIDQPPTRRSPDNEVVLGQFQPFTCEGIQQLLGEKNMDFVTYSLQQAGQAYHVHIVRGRRFLLVTQRAVPTELLDDFVANEAKLESALLFGQITGIDFQRQQDDLYMQIFRSVPVMVVPIDQEKPRSPKVLDFKAYDDKR